ncbi:MAG: hypothetical protein HXS48_02145 [Theionarchaea archaeon]|nr:hypothetical protein [Theionarchaea archaeon]
MELADEVKVALVTAACVLGIAVIFKNVLHVQADFIVSNGPFYLFIVYLITRAQAKKSKCDNPLYWSAAIIFVALVTIALYAI